MVLIHAPILCLRFFYNYFSDAPIKCGGPLALAGVYDNNAKNFECAIKAVHLQRLSALTRALERLRTCFL